MRKTTTRKFFKRFAIIIALLLLLLISYVEIMNRHSKDLTYRQKVLKAFYPLLMWAGKASGKKVKHMENSKINMPSTSIYDLSIQLNNGSKLDLSSLKGKKILLVNTASNCGYTSQYEDLQSLYEKNKDKLVIIGFPANDFKEQEKGTDEQIAEFCKVNFGVTFPLATKSTVIKGGSQNPVFNWLSDKKQNGWNDQDPTWNFSKYLVNENGVLTDYFDPGLSPVSNEIKNAIAK